MGERIAWSLTDSQKSLGKQLQVVSRHATRLLGGDALYFRDISVSV
jgi:hypothetical protein